MIGKGKQEGKRSKPLCLKTEGSAATIPRSLQNSRRGAAKKGEDEGSPATQGRGSAEGVKSRTCKREDGKGWRCGNEAKAGSTLCEHHLSQVRSYCKRPSNDSSKRRSPSKPEGGEGRRKRPTAQSSWATTPFEKEQAKSSNFKSSRNLLGQIWYSPSLNLSDGDFLRRRDEQWDLSVPALVDPGACCSGNTSIQLISS
ncbi:hypothetical protein EJ110_NYTH08083 [Nymphaea thermarum]|nr:hypothetical protein EJ110_NYTH08083 [Nymphaea thermarum]